MAAHRTSYEPLHRGSHAAIALGSKLHMWGGLVARSIEKSRELTQYVEVFDVATELWDQKLTQGTPPPGIINTAYTVVGTCLFVFGGFDGVSRHNSLFKLDLQTYQWEQVQAADPSSGPQKKGGCRMVSYGDNQLVIFAGRTESGGNTDELHVFNLDKREWSCPTETGTKPPPLTWFTFTKVDKRRAVVYGGYTGEGLCGDAYVLELDKWNWSKLDNTVGSRPCARHSHTACCITGPLTGQKHPLLLVGGGVNRVVQDDLKDMWILDVDSGVWNEVKQLKTRSYHTMTMFGCGPIFRMVVMFGGVRNIGGDTIAETTLLHLELQGSKWKVTRVGELGRPLKRLKEQMKKLQLDPSDSVSTKSERKALGLERELVKAEKKIADLQSKVEEAESRASHAEKITNDLIRQMTDTNQKMREAEARAQDSHQKATETEERAKQAEMGARFLQQQIEDMAVRVREAQLIARESQERTKMNEQRPQGLDVRGEQFWVVHREEIQLTDQELGRGGWAVVRVATFRGLKVAAKCLHSLIISDYNRQLFAREMSIAARVRHPNLVQFIGATTEGEPIILTELMATSLRAILERRPFNPAQIISMSLDVARALNYLHLTSPYPIIHRDLSSANVLLDPGPSNSWKAKVSDYGSANFLQQLKTAGPGNPTYAAPEADIPSQQSTKMDVYSYGVLLLEICSRRFPDPEEYETLLQRVQQPAMVALIQQCMEREPSKRPTMSEIIERLYTE